MRAGDLKKLRIRFLMVLLLALLAGCSAEAELVCIRPTAHEIDQKLQELGFQPVLVEMDACSAQVLYESDEQFGYCSLTRFADTGEIGYSCEGVMRGEEGNSTPRVIPYEDHQLGIIIPDAETAQRINRVEVLYQSEPPVAWETLGQRGVLVDLPWEANQWQQIVFYDGEDTEVGRLDCCTRPAWLQNTEPSMAVDGPSQ